MRSNIVILGAGFGGLRASLVLGTYKKRGKLSNHEIVLIDKNNYHTYTPTLYEISTTSKEVANYIDLKSVNTFPIRKILGKLPVKFIKADIVKIDAQKGHVHLRDGRRIPYTHLIIALGSQTNFFGIPGMERYALELKSFTDAVKIRDGVWEKIESAKPNEHVRIVIGGGGTTGVELAGELQGWIQELKKQGYNCGATVTLIEAATTILSPFGKRIAGIATKRLTKIGTEIITGEKIERADSSHVYLQSGKRIPYDLLVWTGGIKANDLTKHLPAQTDEKKRVKADREMLCVPQAPDLRVKGNIYAIGDVACVNDPKTGSPVPGVARAAISQGTVAAKNIVRDVEKKPRITFRPWRYPYIIPVGGKYAIAKIGPVVITGLFGWILKGLVELNYILSIMPVRDALSIWLKGLKIFIQNDRLG